MHGKEIEGKMKAKEEKYLIEGAAMSLALSSEINGSSFSEPFF